MYIRMFMLLGEKVNEHFPYLLGCQIGIHLKVEKYLNKESSYFRSSYWVTLNSMNAIWSIQQWVFKNQAKASPWSFWKTCLQLLLLPTDWRNWKHATFTKKTTTTTVTKIRDPRSKIPNENKFELFWHYYLLAVKLRSKEECTMTLYMLLCFWSLYYGAK